MNYVKLATVQTKFDIFGFERLIGGRKKRFINYIYIQSNEIHSVAALIVY